MTDCLKCGKCCRFVALPFGGKITPDVVRWHNAHGIKVVQKEELGMFHGKVLIPLECKHFKDGRCGIYEERPQVCRDFESGGEVCKEAIENFGVLYG